MYSPIHEDDINAQTEALLEGGVGARHPRQLGAATSRSPPRSGAPTWPSSPARPRRSSSRRSRAGSAAWSCDTTRRLAITGPAKVTWREGVRRLVEHRQHGDVGANVHTGATWLAESME